MKKMGAPKKKKKIPQLHVISARNPARAGPKRGSSAGPEAATYPKTAAVGPGAKNRAKGVTPKAKKAPRRKRDVRRSARLRQRNYRAQKKKACEVDLFHWCTARLWKPGPLRSTLWFLVRSFFDLPGARCGAPPTRPRCIPARLRAVLQEALPRYRPEKSLRRCAGASRATPGDIMRPAHPHSAVAGPWHAGSRPRNGRIFVSASLYYTYVRNGAL